MFEPWAPGKVDGPMDRSKSGPPTRAKMSDKIPANDESTVIAVDHGSTPNIISTIWIHNDPYLFSPFSGVGAQGFGLTSKFHGMAPNFGEWHVLQSDCLFFFLFFFPHLAIKIPWGSLKCDLCGGSWCGCITAAEFAGFTPFQQAAQWPWLRQRSECQGVPRSASGCQGTPPLGSTWKQPPEREKYETCAENSTMSCFGCMFDIVRLHCFSLFRLQHQPSHSNPFRKTLDIDTGPAIFGRHQGGHSDAQEDLTTDSTFGDEKPTRRSPAKGR